MSKTLTYTIYQLLQVLESGNLNQTVENVGYVGKLIPYDPTTGNQITDGTADVGAVPTPTGDIYITEDRKIKIVRIGSPNVVIGEVSLTGGISWIQITKTYADFATAALTNSIDLFIIPAKSVLHNTFVKHSAQFLGGGITAYDIRTGITGAPQKFSVPFDVFQSVGNQNFGQYVYGAIENYGAATTIKVAANSVGANLNAATQGVVDIQLFISNLV
jgi:hypothetical protein